MTPPFMLLLLWEWTAQPVLMALELQATLLRERFDTFLVVLTVEAIDDHLLQHGQVALPGPSPACLKKVSHHHTAIHAKHLTSDIGSVVRR